MRLGEFGQFACLLWLVHIIICGCLLTSEDRTELRHLLGCDGIRERDFEINKQVAEVEALLVEGHAEADTSHHAVRLDNLPGRVLNSNCAAIEMLHGEVNTGERLL